MNILVECNRSIDRILHNLFCDRDSYVYQILSNTNEKFKKTLALSSLVLIEEYGFKKILNLDTGISKDDYIEIYNELDNTNIILDVSEDEVNKWYLFILETLKEKEKLYEKIVNSKINVRVCISAELPSPPIGQIVRTDYLDEILNVSILLGYVDFNERENREYPLTKEWLYRGVELSLLKYLFPFDDMLNNFNSLTNFKYEKRFIQVFSNIIWYIQVKIFSTDFILIEGSTPTIDFILELNKIDTFNWNNNDLENLNTREIERNILFLVKYLFDKDENKNE